MCKEVCEQLSVKHIRWQKGIGVDDLDKLNTGKKFVLVVELAVVPAYLFAAFVTLLYF
jgi:hypothetical protein